MSQQVYRKVLSNLGWALTSRHARPKRELAGVEARLGVTIPAALAALQRVAGRAAIGGYWNVFEEPSSWWLDGARLVFATEQQGVVIYAVDTAVSDADPPLLMAGNAEPYRWQKVCPRLSAGLNVLIHWEAVNGGMTVGGWAFVRPSIRGTLSRSFTAVGEVNKMWAYGRAGSAVCVLKWTDGWRAFVGATSTRRLADVERELNVSIEQW